jgi:hypothetical protein
VSSHSQTEPLQERHKGRLLLADVGVATRPGPVCGNVTRAIVATHSLFGSSSSSPENSGVTRRECGYTRYVL